MGSPGSLLGVDRDVDRHDVTAGLGPGDSLVSSTDGIVERRGGRRSFEEDGVAAVPEVSVGRSADEVVADAEGTGRRVAGAPPGVGAVG